MDGKVKVTGLKAAVNAMSKAFPKNPDQQRRLLNASMRSAAKGTILADAKQRAASSDGSGALSTALGMRTSPKRALLSKRRSGGIYITPIRHNMAAIAKYVSFYGRNSAGVVVSGIRHGHLVEFGHATRGGGHVAAQPFLWPATSKKGPYKTQFALDLRKKTEAAVKRAAKKGKR